MSSAATVVGLQSRINDLVDRLGAAEFDARDARRDAEKAKEAAQSRGRRAKEAKAEAARLRSENAELLNAVRRLRSENRELTAGAQAVLDAVNRFDE